LDNIIAVDGPAGSGKSTIAKLLAKQLGFHYIDTGAMYRAFTLKAINKGLDLTKEQALSLLAAETEIDIINDPEGELKVMLDGEDVASLIRTPELTKNVAHVARVEGVREKMKERQHEIAARRNCVFEGRDIGTVVFPEAKYKFYLDADFNERVSRRFKELKERSQEIVHEEISKDLKIRDHKDMSRQIAPLKRAEDAVYIDTTNMDINEVVDKLASYIKVD